jgi:uncharacterized membrane protein YhaH (DUF805 family)
MPRHSAIPPPADLCDLGNIPTTLTQQFMFVELSLFYDVEMQMSISFLFCLLLVLLFCANASLVNERLHSILDQRGHLFD